MTFRSHEKLVSNIVETEESDMSSRFQFLGVVFGPDLLPPHPQLASHASNPTPLHLGGAEYRVFYASRDEQNRSSLSFFDLDVDAREVTNIGQEPLFSFGGTGTFFSHGVTPGSIYEADGHLWLSFMGWQIPRQGEHWCGELGLLKLDKEKLKTSLHSGQPLLGRREWDTLSLSYPGVVRLDSGSYLMVFGSTVTWDAGNDEMLHVLRAAGSPGGFNWHPIGHPHPHSLGTAQAFSGPNLLSRGEGIYDVYFSYRGAPPSKYRIGCSRFDSKNSSWQRLPDPVISGLDPHSIGVEMQAYPSVFRHDGRTLMLFNGDGYGRTGVGLAVES